MGYYSPEEIDKLEQQLLQRQSALIDRMRGRAITESEVHDTRRAESSRYVIAEDVKVAVDDYKTILASIKRTLNK